MDQRIRKDVELYADSAIRLLRAVPNQRPDPIAQREVEDKIQVMQSRLEHFDRTLRESLEKALAEGLLAARNSQLGLTLAYMERVKELLRAED